MISIPYTEFRFETSRSGGPGGQNVNKIESRVRLLWDPLASEGLTERQKETLLKNLEIQSRMTQAGEVSIICQVHRTQRLNRDEAVARLLEIVKKALTPRRRRVATKATRGSVERRIQAKKKQGARKVLRRGGGEE